jgi:hypothetical protein
MRRETRVGKSGPRPILAAFAVAGLVAGAAQTALAQGTLIICQSSGNDVAVSEFRFSLNAGAPFTLAAGRCSVPVPIAAGDVTIEQLPTSPETKVSGISVLASRLVRRVSPNPNLEQRRVVVRVPDGSTARAGTRVTFTHDPSVNSTQPGRTESDGWMTRALAPGLILVVAILLLGAARLAGSADPRRGATVGGERSRVRRPHWRRPQVAPALVHGGSTDGKAPLEKCKITLWRRGGDCDFFAQAEASQGEDHVATRSPKFRWSGIDSPPEKGAILAAHKILVQRLEWDRWEFEGEGRNWWERSYRRPAKARQVSSGISRMPAGTEPSTRGEGHGDGNAASLAPGVGRSIN